jgi:NDP-sugar pyrophosphorylase family protein
MDFPEISDPDLTVIDVAMLAGGLGTRIRDALGGLPKVLAPLGEETLLDCQIRWLSRWRARRIVLCLGYRHEVILEHIDQLSTETPDLIPSIEHQPRGTAGAIALARPHFQRDTVLVMNGDTLLDGDLSGFIADHRRSNAPCTVLCAEVSDAARYGRVLSDGEGHVTGFEEKARQGPGLVSAGVYLMQRSFIEARLVQVEGSIEKDVFPGALDGSLRSYVGNFRFLDVGTPESLALARADQGNLVAAPRKV